MYITKEYSNGIYKYKIIKNRNNLIYYSSATELLKVEIHTDKSTSWQKVLQNHLNTRNEKL